MIIALLCLCALTCWLDAHPAHGQARPASGVAIEIQGSAALAETCLTSQQLSARVAHYSSPSARPRGLRLVLYITGPDAAELHIVRDGNVVSRRSFTQLPAPCADRRDAVALSIALALERTAAATSSNTSASPSRAVGAADGASASAGRSTGASPSRARNAGDGTGTSAGRPGSNTGASPSRVGDAADGASASGGRSTDASRGSADGAGRNTDASNSRVSGAADASPSRAGDGVDRANVGRARVAGDAAGGSLDAARVGPDAATSGGEASGERPADGAAPAVDVAEARGAAERGGVAAGQVLAESPPVRDARDDAPIVLGTMPTTTSRDPRRKGESTSSLQLQLGGRFALEVVPAPVWVGALGLELPLSSRLTLGITALYSSVGEAALAGARARANFMGLEAVGCANIPLGPFMLQTCGGAAVALCEVSGRDYPRARPEATLLWAAVIGRATVRWPREGFIAARLLLQPHVGISRPELQVEGSSERLRSFWLGGSTGLELWLAL